MFVTYQPSIGHARYRVVEPTDVPKSPAVAVIASLVLPGLGQFYAGSTAAAVLWFVIAIAAWVSVLALIGFVLVPFVMFGACVHAHHSAEVANQRLVH